MIARLRARHRRMWTVLLVVAPVVLAAALSVRRGGAERQAVPGPLRDETVAGPDDSRRTFGGIRWSRDARGRGLLDLYLAPGPGVLGEADVLLYWNPASAPSVAADLSGLPPGAVLLGALGTDSVHRFVLPDGVHEGEGSLVMYSLGHDTSILLPLPVAPPDATSPPR